MVKIIIKTNLSSKHSHIAENFLGYMIKYLYSYANTYTDKKEKLCDSNIIYEWNYEVYCQKYDNRYEITVLEYDDYKPIGRIVYDWYITKEQILQLYILSKLNHESFRNCLKIDYKMEN